MSDFVLIDLHAQHKEVLTYVRNWTAADILDWMKQYGTVTKLTSSHKLYGFTSHSGSNTAFRLSEEEGLVVLQPR